MEHMCHRNRQGIQHSRVAVVHVTLSYAPTCHHPLVMQGAPVRQEYYGVPPPGYYPPPPPAYQKEEAASSGAPWWIWLGAGVLVGQIISKVCARQACVQATGV